MKNQWKLYKNEENSIGSAVFQWRIGENCRKKIKKIASVPRFFNVKSLEIVEKHENIVQNYEIKTSVHASIVSLSVKSVLKSWPREYFM